MFDNGGWIWGIAIAAMLVVVIALFGRQIKGAFSAEGSARYDTTEIPPDDPETREFIVRDDRTGSRLQFVTLHEQGRVVGFVVPQKHLRTGVEVDLFEAALPSAPQVVRWTWPQTTPDGYAALQIIARRMPQLEFIDAGGNRVL